MKKVNVKYDLWRALAIGLCFFGGAGRAFSADSLTTHSPKEDLLFASSADSVEKKTHGALYSKEKTDLANTKEPLSMNEATQIVNRQTASRNPKRYFIPDPKRALWLALVFPGGGQIYNRKYWKLPIFYGGFLGCTYAFMWNQQMYKDYSQAYLDITDNDPNTKSYLNFLPPNYDISGKEERFKVLFKNKKDFYRRYRDMSAFAFIGVYLLSVIDAYVDAQLSVFDISPNLSMSLRPAVIKEPGFYKSATYGIGCSLNF